jgi:hypothetical protein
MADTCSLGECRCGSGAGCAEGRICQSGACVCPSGMLACNGACVPNDANNCGACGVVCPGGTCSQGKCTRCSATAQELSGGAVHIPYNQTGFSLVCPNMSAGARVRYRISGVVSATNPPTENNGCLWVILNLYPFDCTSCGDDVSHEYANGGASYSYSISSDSGVVPANGVMKTQVSNVHCQNQQFRCTAVLDAGSVSVIEVIQ